MKSRRRELFNHIAELLPNTHLCTSLINYAYFFWKHRYLPSKQNLKSINDYFFLVKNSPSSVKYGYFTDKENIKTFVSNVCGEEYIIPTLGVFDDIRALKQFSCREKYIVKPTHMSGEVIIKRGGALSSQEIDMAQKWLRQDYSRISREYVYHSLEPKIIIEPLLAYNGQIPFDYKFFTINGRCEFVQVDIGRFSSHKRDLYDRDFNKLDLKFIYPNSPITLNKPDNYGKMLSIVEKLASFFPFVRVDLYITDDGIKFGELTFVPEGGLGSFEPNAFEEKLLWKLNRNSVLPSTQEERLEVFS